MSAITIRALLRRRRHHLVLISVVVALAAVIVVHHSAMSMSSTDDGMGMGMGAVAEMCLGVVAAVGGAVVAVAIGVLALCRWRPPLVGAPSAPPAVRPPMLRVRDGPALLVLLCVCRR